MLLRLPLSELTLVVGLVVVLTETFPYEVVDAHHFLGQGLVVVAAVVAQQKLIARGLLFWV